MAHGSNRGPLRAIIFDFDGVIVESADIKTRAFAAVFRSYPEHVQAIVNFHLRYVGMTRYEKFRLIYRDILREPLTEGRMEALSRDFSVCVFDAIVQCELVAGAQEFLAEYGRQILLFVVSAKP